MYIQDHKVHFDYNFLDGVHYHITSKELPKGNVDIKYDFKKTGPWAGTGYLYINGELQGEADMPKMHITTYSLAETFDIGIDYGTQVDPNYEGSPFAFTGTLDRVIVTLTD